MVVLRSPDGTVHTPERDHAYLRVRLSEPARPTGTVTVYLDDGTALVVPERDLLTVAPADPER